MRLLNAAEVERLLDAASCIHAVEHAFRARGQGRRAPGGVLGLELDGGSLHAKVASLDLPRPYAVAKINANFPGNPVERGLPTIQGVLVLFDAICGVPLAVMDSASITTARTAATTAVAAAHLARRDASTVGFVGCGVQARAHLVALREVRAIDHVFAFDADPAAAERFAAEARGLSDVSADAVRDLREATGASDIIVTSTPSRHALLHLGDVAAGTFVAAVGADNEHKQEIDATLLRAALVIADDLEQCARMGDLHHALVAGVMMPTDVRGSLDQVIAGVCAGRSTDDEIIIFDSTGLAIEDVAAAAVVYERAEEGDVGLVVELARSHPLSS